MSEQIVPARDEAALEELCTDPDAYFAKVRRFNEDQKTHLVRTKGGTSVHKRDCYFASMGKPWIWAEGKSKTEILSETMGFGYKYCQRCKPLEGLPIDGGSSEADNIIAEALRIDSDDKPDSWSRKVWPHRAGVALSALAKAGYAVVKLPAPKISLHGRHEVPGTGMQIQFTDTDFVMWIPNGVDSTTLRKTFDREAGDVLIGALLAARDGRVTK